MSKTSWKKLPNWPVSSAAPDHHRRPYRQLDEGSGPVEAVKDLSLKRANAIKEALLKKYTDLDPNRFNVDGVGWDNRPSRATGEPRSTAG